MLFDISGIDLDKVVYDQDVIRQYNPQRGEMEHLNAITYVDTARACLVGYKDVRPDEFWVPGHIPGRPLLPGVIMIEAAAQLASFYTRKFENWDGFIGFGGADEVRFRAPVEPGDRLYVMGMKVWTRHRRFCSKMQGLVKGSLVFEATIIGVIM
jgi:3-hydroxyacyl-[acyl-carrier-protein] dehydratase